MLEMLAGFHVGSQSLDPYALMSAGDKEGTNVPMSAPASITIEDRYHPAFLI